VLNYSWKASLNLWGRLEFNTSFWIGFGSTMMVILRMVILYIIAIIHIMHIIISMCYYYNYACYCNYAHYFMFCFIGWLESVGSRVVYVLDYKKPILYVIPIPGQSILGKLPFVPVGDTGTIQYHLCNTFSGAPCDRRQGPGDGCKMWFVNSWALGWSRDM
jgi:hypothetical protein